MRVLNLSSYGRSPNNKLLENKSYYASSGSELTTQDCSFRESFLNPFSEVGLHLSSEGLIIFPLLDSWSSAFTASTDFWLPSITSFILARTRFLLSTGSYESFSKSKTYIKMKMQISSAYLKLKRQKTMKTNIRQCIIGAIHHKFLFAVS